MIGPVIPAYERDGSLPFPEPSRRRLSDRAVILWIAGALVLLAIGIGGYLVVRGHSSSSNAAATASSGMTPSTTQDGRDLSQISNDELEAAVAANPDVVAMRLALVERYLTAADGEHDDAARVQQLDKAKFHAGEAAARATTPEDQARSLRYLGWTTAMTTDPAQGAAFLEQSLEQDPSNPDTLWFLAVVRFERLGDAASALPLLQQLQSLATTDTQRQAVQSELTKINAALNRH
jgi:cytochrome c-type biogenesis protein CcmH/NrfG